VNRSLISRFSCAIVRSLYLFMLDLIISCINGIFKSSCRVWFETYHGAPVTVMKSVVRIRLVKTENSIVHETVNCKVCRSTIALHRL
jgi:hypothetical protein